MIANFRLAIADLKLAIGNLATGNSFTFYSARRATP
jgi:hypothetical protein